MCYPDGMVDGDFSMQTCYCNNCNTEYEIEGYKDLGMWDPVNEDNRQCPGCSSWDTEIIG